MKKTVFVCDRCHNETFDGKAIDLATVSLQITYSFTNTPNTRMSQDWCSKCRIKTGLNTVAPENIKKETGLDKLPEPITLDSLVREIVANEIEWRKDA